LTTEKTAVALRVLTAINRLEQPEERDVILLRAYCPDHRSLAPDELARLVTRQAQGTGRQGHATQDGLSVPDLP